jgi:two-component system phosphate regulon response regulator PhoB
MTRDRILLIEDEPDLAAPVAHYLEAVGFRTEIGADAASGLAAARREVPDLVLLDLMLPDRSGVEVCRDLRAEVATSGVPILMLTARSADEDRIGGFEAGADDYVTKPCNLRELGLRVTALLRRARGAAPAPAAAGPVRSGGLELDPEGHVARIDGVELGLTVVEFRLLLTFLQRAGTAMTREEICSHTWGESYAISGRAVDTNVKRLRRKLGRFGESLTTVRGVGYRWVPVGGAP